MLPRRSKWLETIVEKRHYWHAMLDSLNLSCQPACVLYYYPMRPAYQSIWIFDKYDNLTKNAWTHFKWTCFFQVKWVQLFTLIWNTLRFKALTCSTCGIILGFALSDPCTLFLFPTSATKTVGWTLWGRSLTQATWDTGLRPICRTQELPHRLPHTDPEKGRTWNSSHLVATMCTACT